MSARSPRIVVPWTAMMLAGAIAGAAPPGSGEGPGGAPPSTRSSLEMPGVLSAAIELMDATGMAPFAVHVHALNGEVGTGDQLSARYTWDFGDPDGVYNTLLGWNAGHVYNEPGIYLITLTVTDENGNSDSDTVQVTVSADTRDRLYVAESGDDDNNGNSPSQAVRTLGRAIELLDHDTSVLFRRDDVFNVSSAPAEIKKTNVVFSSYGTGALPVLRWTGGLGLNQMLVLNGDFSKDTFFDGLHFDSAYHTTGERNIISVIVPAGQNTVVRGCRFDHVTDAMNCERQPKGLISQDNIAPIPDGLRAYYCWLRGSDHTHLGNIVNGSMHEHNIRVGGEAERVLLAFNNLTNFPKTTIWNMVGRDVYLCGNVIHTGQVAVGPNPFGDSPGDRSRWCVVERCRFVTDISSIELKAGALHVMLRNNILEAHGHSGIKVNGYDPVNSRTCTDVRILNNTGVNDLDGGRFLDVGPAVESVRVINNLYAAPNLVTGTGRTANVYVEDNNLDGFNDIRHNVWAEPAGFEWVPDGYHYLWPYWSDPEGYRNTTEWEAMSEVYDEVYAKTELDVAFAPPPGSVAMNHGEPVDGVHTDFYGHVRPPTGNWVAGAVRFGPGGDGLVGDLDGDGQVGTMDLIVLLGAWGSSSAVADLTGDGVVNVADLTLLISNWTAPTVPGDLDGDGVVSSLDLIILLGMWGTDDPAGDLNGDGIVDGGDLLLLLVFWTV